MQKEQFYMSNATGEITFDHNEAVEWYRNGDEISIYKNGEVRAAWVY